MDWDKLLNSLTFTFPFTFEEWKNKPFIENYHYHTSMSNPMTTDSPVSNEDYAKKIVEYGAKCIFSGEHGFQGNQFEVHTLSQKYNLKYRHSCEAYWVKDRTEKDNSNCHICIIALNDEGRKELNYILSEANISGYYYKPRLDLELILSLNPKNFIITSACIAGWKYNNADEIWLKIFKHFKDNFFLEVQYHNTDKQKQLNKHILDLSNKYNIQIICGLDSHYIDVEKDDIKRTELLLEKNIRYEDEEGWYLDYPDFNTIYNRFVEQNILSEYEICLAMINTLVFDSSKCNECNFSKEFKIPNIYKDLSYEERCKLYKDKLYQAYKKDGLFSKERVDGIEYEAKQFIESNTVDYPLITEAIIRKAVDEYNGVLTTTSRGSASSFYTNKLIGITTLDRFSAEIPIYPERFLTKERVLSGQMPDCDLNISEQEPFRQASRDLLGQYGCYPLITVCYLKVKAAWRMYARLNNVLPSESDIISKSIDSYTEALKYADENDKENIKIEDFIPEKYVDLFNKSKEYQGIIDRLGVHACAHLIFMGDIRKEIGLISVVSASTKKRTICACAEGKYLDDYGYVKEDFLIVDSVTLIDKFWKSIGQKVPTFNELRELVTNDKPTWDIYAKGITCCVNQMEKESTTKKCMKYKPKNLAELSSLISAIRPGFKTLLPQFLNREYYTTGERQVDLLLEDSAHYALFQESLMKVLNFCEMPMGETYSVIKAISKKKYVSHPEKLIELKDKLKVGWMNKIGNLDNFNKVWDVIESSAFYSFNAPHALSMGGDSAYQAYFKAHYTSKFYEVALNHYIEKSNKDKVQALIKEATKFFKYNVSMGKFGEDNRKVFVDDKTKTIIRSFDSIKNIQKIVPNVLYEMSVNKNNYPNLFFIFQDLKANGLNKKSIDIIFKLNYFKEYGDINYIIQQWNVYNDVKAIIDKLESCKQLKKIDCINYGLDIDDVKKFANKETEKQFKEIDNNKLYHYALDNYEKIVACISKKYPYEKAQKIQEIAYELDFSGYTNITDNTIGSNIYCISSIEENKYGTRFITLYHINDGNNSTYKVSRSSFQDHPCDVGDIVKCIIRQQYKRKKDDNGKWIEDKDNIETIIKDYTIIKKCD